MLTNKEQWALIRITSHFLKQISVPYLCAVLYYDIFCNNINNYIINYLHCIVREHLKMFVEWIAWLFLDLKLDIIEKRTFFSEVLQKSDLLFICEVIEIEGVSEAVESVAHEVGQIRVSRPVIDV